MARRANASMYIHPWDVVDEGTKTVLERITSTGISTLNLATSYHSGRYILAHNPNRRSYYAEEGVVYFEPQMSLYENTSLKPRRSTEFRNTDVLDLLLRDAKDYGVKVNSWTVTFHNSWLARAHPQAAVEDALGDLNYNYLCPNNPDVRNYHKALVRNLAEYEVNAILLETSSFPPTFEHGDHHEMFGIEIEPFVSELLTFCFCKHCIKRARESGIDLPRARKLIVELIETSFEFPTHVLRGTPFAEKLKTSNTFLSDFKQLSDLFFFQREVVDEVFKEAKETLIEGGGRRRPELRVLAFGGFSGENSGGRGAGGQNISTLGKIVDGVDLMTYVTEPDHLYYLVRWCKLEAGSCPLYVALRPSHPTLFTPEVVAAEIKYSLDAGASGVEFYNYGWTPLPNFHWIRKGLENAP